MTKKRFKFSSTVVDYYFDGKLGELKKIVDQNNAVIITDENVFNAHAGKFKKWNTIVLKPGEAYKVQQTVDSVIDQLIEMGADRKTTLIGVGGGVVTDLTGYAASIYMRGINFGFVPTSLLAMVDASIGGKNGIDVGVYKNMVGTIRQPSFLLFDTDLLKSLPDAEWINGFAEIIKHACIKDSTMFRNLEAHDIGFYKKGKKSIAELVKRNVLIKTKVVQQDEFEKADRKLLNYGHTLAHAIENKYELSHGQAVSIGMTYAAHFSHDLLGFRGIERLTALLGRYQLPTYADFERQQAYEVLLKDKKKTGAGMNYILLSRIGKGVIKVIPLDELQKMILAI